MAWFNKVKRVIVFLLLLQTFAIASNEILTFDNEELRDRYQQLTFELRCPKCQNQNVADSNAPISVDIRHKTYAMLHQGYSDQEIIDFMIARYTEFVIYKPQMSVVTVWLWIFPGVLLIAGLLLLWRFTRKPKSLESAALTAEEEQKLKALLEETSE